MQSKKKSNDISFSDSKLDWHHYIRLFKRKKWLFLGVFIVVSLFSMAVAWKLSPRPVYTTQALLQFQDTRALSEMNTRGKPEFESKIGILMSRNFLGKVVDKLSLVVRFSGVDRYDAVDSVYLHPNYLTGKFELRKQGNKLILYYTSKDRSIENKKVLEVDYPDNNIIEYGKVGIVLKKSYWNKHEKLVYSVNSRDRAIHNLLNSLSFKFKNRARTLLSISISGVDRHLIA
ncbi:hypothetical protein DRI50_01840, partial [candidate division KSB1 bacterium]